MFLLTKLLSRHGGLRITFINTHHNHARLRKFTDLATFHTQFPNINFTSITDGLPKDDPRSTIIEFFPHMIAPEARSKVANEFRELFISLLNKNSHLQPPSCIIADGLMSTIAMGVAQEFNVPLIVFRTYSATCTWVSIHISKLIHEGVTDQDEMDKMITRIPGLENLLRGRRDFLTAFILKAQDFYVKETLAMTQASALLLNTFDHLEAPIISKLATIFPKVYTIGPLHTFLKTQATNISTPLLSNKDGGGLRKEDRSCITWLDNQKPKSVLYVSFGTVVTLSHEELLEFWHGLVNSAKPFLWVIRHDLIINGEGGLVHNNNNNNNNVPLELELETKKRGLVVDWAPQEEVLAHPSVGGFLTHSGWNSTLESISEGVPMLCWPILADQPVNSRCVSELWRIGLDMNGTSDRLVVEKMVRDLMENHKEVLSISMGEIAKEAKDSVKEFGSSYHNLENLIKNITSVKLSN
ncbi:hypothetical protein RIF29_28012 [Crotalaria pallida]|uniref:Glycosyltransferase n=1 Tax=Crotalaria pallida TaxID=3830 RepID=A0AAN9ESB6_CROPI